MKKIKKKYIFGFLILALVVVLTCEISYLAIKNQTATKESQNSNPKEPPKEELTPPKEPDKPEKPNQSNENITLSSKELEKYLSYVPYYYQSDNAYVPKLKNFDSLNEDFLKIVVLNTIQECLDDDEITCPFDHSTPRTIKAELKYYEGDKTSNYIPLTYVNKILKENYNIELTNLKNAKNDAEDAFQVDGMKFIYEDGYFLRLNGGGKWDTGNHMSILANYTATNEELIIYEYAASYQTSDEQLNNANFLIDYRNNKKIDLTNTCSENDNNCALNTLKQHQNEYTKYKHTFKKNSTGYYWTKTEVA